MPVEIFIDIKLDEYQRYMAQVVGRIGIQQLIQKIVVAGWKDAQEVWFSEIMPSTPWRGYQTGRYQDSFKEQMAPNYDWVRFGPQVEYSQYVEAGTRSFKGHWPIKREAERLEKRLQGTVDQIVANHCRA
jgi:hypothetical protein